MNLASELVVKIIFALRIELVFSFQLASDSTNKTLADEHI